MASLLQDGIILFSSIVEFLDAHRSDIARGGLYLDTEHTWPVRTVQTFIVQVAGKPLRAEINAEIVFMGQGKVGLQLADDPATASALDALAREAGGIASPDQNGDEPAITAPPATVRSDTPVTSRPGAAAPAPAPPPCPDLGDEWEIRGTVEAFQSPDHLLSVRPVALTHTISTMTLPVLVASVASGGRALALTIDPLRDPICLRFNDRGNLIQFLAPSAGEDLLDRLLQHRLITRHQHDELQLEIDEDTSVEAELAKRKTVKLARVWETIRDQAVDALLLVTQHGGTTDFRIEPTKTGRKTGIPVARLMIPFLLGCIADIESENLEQLLEPLQKEQLKLVDPLPWPRKSFGIDKQDWSFFNTCLDGTRTLAKSLELVPLQRRQQAMRLVAAFQALGLLTSTGQAEMKHVDVDPLEALEQEIQDLESGDPFAQAGIHWTEHPENFEQAMATLETQYGPGSHRATLSPRAADLCQRRLGLARSAQRDLKDPARRHACRLKKVGEYQMKSSAEVLARQAEMSILKHDVDRARQLLETAMELHPRQQYKNKLMSLPR